MQDVKWWLTRFGPLGRFVRTSTLDSLATAHDEHLNAQAQITSGHQRAYGSVNFSAQAFFHEALRERPEVSFVPPKRGVPKVPVVAGRAVVFWRYANKGGVDAMQKKFGTSESRIAAFKIHRAPHQEVLTFDVDEVLNLTAEDRKFLDVVGTAAAIEEDGTYPVTVVAYSSNTAGLYEVLCADAQMNEDGTLQLVDVLSMTNDLRGVQADTSIHEVKRFDKAPRKQLNLKTKSVNER